MTNDTPSDVPPPASPKGPPEAMSDPPKDEPRLKLHSFRTPDAPAGKTVPENGAGGGFWKNTEGKTEKKPWGKTDSRPGAGPTGEQSDNSEAKKESLQNANRRIVKLFPPRSGSKYVGKKGRSAFLVGAGIFFLCLLYSLRGVFLPNPVEVIHGDWVIDFEASRDRINSIVFASVKENEQMRKSVQLEMMHPDSKRTPADQYLLQVLSSPLAAEKSREAGLQILKALESSYQSHRDDVLLIDMRKKVVRHTGQQYLATGATQMPFTKTEVSGKRIRLLSGMEDGTTANTILDVEVVDEDHIVSGTFVYKRPPLPVRH